LARTASADTRQGLLREYYIHRLRQNTPAPQTPPLLDFNPLNTQEVVESGDDGIALGVVGPGKISNGSLCVLAEILGSLVGVADVGELIADTVGDDVVVERILLALGDKGVHGEESALVGLAASTTKFEADAGVADTEVNSTVSGVASVTGIASVTSGSRGSDDGGKRSRAPAGNGCGRGGRGSGSTTSRGTAGSVGSSPSQILEGEVGEAVGDHDLGDAEAHSVEGVGNRGGRVGVLNIGTHDGGIDERDDAAKSLGNRQGSIIADGGDGLREGVEVLLGSDQSNSGGDDGSIIAELRDDGVGKLKLASVLDHAHKICAWENGETNLGAGVGTSK